MDLDRSPHDLVEGLHNLRHTIARWMGRLEACQQFNWRAWQTTSIYLCSVTALSVWLRVGAGGHSRAAGRPSSTAEVGSIRIPGQRRRSWFGNERESGAV